MKIHTAKIIFSSLITASILALPALSRAQDADSSAPAAAKSKHGAPFHGTVDSLDTNAMTLTVGSRTFQITSDTRIFKNDKPAILADGTPGQHVSGYYKPADEGTNLNASSVYFGTHATKPRVKKKKAPAPEMTATNAPSAMPMNTPPPPTTTAPPPPVNSPATTVPPPPPSTPPMTSTNVGP
jgi:hypothetical protein